MNTSYLSLVSQLTARAALTVGASKDLAKCFDKTSHYEFSEKCYEFGSKMGVDFALIFELPQKQIFRAIGFVNAVNTGLMNNFDYSHARILCALRLAGKFDLNTDALTALVAGTHDPRANVRGITSDNVNRMFSRSHGASTVGTKISNSTGKNGFMQALGLTFGIPGETNHPLSVNLDHPLSIAFFNRIDNASSGQIDAMNDKGIKA